MERVLSHSPPFTNFYLVVSVVLVLLFLPVTGWCSSSTGDAKTIVVNGEGPTRDKALKVAWRNAVENTVGGYISSQTLVKNHQLIEDKILAYSDGYIEDFHIISEGYKDSKYWVKIKAKVKQGQILTDLKRHKIDIKGESLYATLMTYKESKKSRGKMCLEELSRLKYPTDYATVDFDDMGVLPSTVSVGRKEYAEIVVRGIRLKVQHERMQKLSDWVKESWNTKNKHISDAIVKIYGLPPGDDQTLYGYRRISWRNYKDGIWTPVIALQFYDKAGRLLHETKHPSGVGEPTVRKQAPFPYFLMEDNYYRKGYIYRVPVDILKQTKKAELVVAPSTYSAWKTPEIYRRQ